MGTNICPNKLWHICQQQVWVTHPGGWLPKWGSRGAERMVCMGHLALTGSTDAPNMALYRTSQHLKNTARCEFHFTFNIRQKSGWQGAIRRLKNSAVLRFIAI